MSSSIAGKVAVVTGASRGIGKGVARALGEQGAIVYVTGRTAGAGERTIDTTARLIDEAGAVIVNVSSPGGRKYHFSCSYGIGKAGLDRLTADMAIELEPKGVAAVALYPGSVSTEFIEDVAAEQGMDLSNAQTPLFVGRSVCALLASDDLMARTGTIQWVEDLGEEFDLLDEHGQRPPGYAER